MWANTTVSPFVPLLDLVDLTISPLTPLILTFTQPNLTYKEKGSNRQTKNKNVASGMMWQPDQHFLCLSTWYILIVNSLNDRRELCSLLHTKTNVWSDYRPKDKQ